MRSLIGWLCAALLWLGPVRVGAVDCGSLPHPAPIDFDSVRVFSFAGGANCWGYIAPDGTEYALMGGQNGIGVVDITTMLTVAIVPAQFCQWRELKTYRHYCYAVSECTGNPNPGMMIIDLQYLPDSAHLVGTYTIPLQNRSHCISIDTVKGYCYLVRNYNGFHILSLANPESPLWVNAVTTPDMHDMTVFNDTVYVAEANNHSFSIWDVGDKLNPALLARVVIPAGGYVHNIWPTPDRKYLATTEETANKTMKIWNRQDLSNITLVAEYLGPSNLAHNAHIEGHYLYLSHYESGVSVLDITTPECPVEVARFDTYLPADLPQFQGCWGVFPHNFNRSHRIYASNIDGRLFVFHQDTSTVSFWATPQIGLAPLSVSFAGFSPLATGWDWHFGDGDSAGVQNPTHVYAPGIFNVQLQVNLPSGTGTKTQTHFITALAETLKVSDTIVAQGASVYWEIRARNNVPIREITLPVTLSNVPAFANFDSISVVGCRTSYFQLKQTLLDQRGSGKFAILLRADNGGGAPPLAAGNGPLARVYMRIQPGPPTGSTIALSLGPLGSASLSATTLTTTYVPIFSAATAFISTLSAQFSGSPTSGSAPLAVNFTPQPSDATGWKWSFGDGDSSLAPNPSHIYAPGLYDVRLEATGLVGTVAQTKTRFITALAETLSAGDTIVAAGNNVVWEIRAVNHVPISDLTLPIALSNVPGQASFDSIKTSGCRTGYFESQQMVFDDRDHGAAVLQLTANGGGGALPLPPGDGAIAKIYLTIPPTAITGQKVALSMPAIGFYQLIASTLSISFVPSLRSGAATITGGTPCDCHCHADPACDGQIDVVDVIQTVNVAFRAQAATVDAACLRERTDVDCSGSTDVLDVARVIDVAFRAADPLAVFCDACSP